MQTPEEFAAELYEVVDFWDHSWKVNDEGGSVAADLIRARDAEVRADEREQCSRIHSALTDDDLVAELVRRGVLREEWKRDSCAAPCPDTSRWGGQPCLLPCDLERGHDEAHEHDECSEDRKHVWGRKADDGAFLASHRHVTAWSEEDDIKAHNWAVLSLADTAKAHEQGGQS